MCAKNWFASSVTPVQKEQHLSHKNLRSYPEVVTFPLKICPADEAVTEYDATILRYMQPAYMTSQRYPDDLVTKFCMVADVYEEATQNNVLIQDSGKSIRHSSQKYQEANLQAGFTDIAFKVNLLLVSQKGTRQQPTVNKPPSTSSRPYYKKPWTKGSSPNIVTFGTKSRARRSSRRLSKSLQEMHLQYPCEQLSNESFAISFLSTTFFVRPNFCDVGYYSNHSPSMCSLLANLHLAQFATIRLANMKKLQTFRWPRNPNEALNYWNNQFGGRRYSGHPTSELKTRVI